jgi:hypothetical protein
VDWLVRDWDQGSVIAFVVGAATGIALVLIGAHGLAELGAGLVSAGIRWSLWQIPPPGRSRALGTPADGWSRIAQVVIAVLLVTLLLELASASVGG